MTDAKELDILTECFSAAYVDAFDNGLSVDKCRRAGVAAVLRTEKAQPNYIPPTVDEVVHLLQTTYSTEWLVRAQQIIDLFNSKNKPWAIVPDGTIINKGTLVRRVAENGYASEYVTLNDVTVPGSYQDSVWAIDPDTVPAPEDPAVEVLAMYLAQGVTITGYDRERARDVLKEIGDARVAK